jgi:hypothetical protein
MEWTETRSAIEKKKSIDRDSLLRLKAVAIIKCISVKTQNLNPNTAVQPVG